MPIKYEFDPIEEFDLDIPRKNRKEALEAASNFIRESMLEYIAEGKSPVSGGKWKRSLSKAYKEIKSQESSASFSNIELTGELLDNIDVAPKAGKILIEVDPSVEGKAEGNLLGSYGREPDKNKAREFMPTGEQKFKRDILSNLKTLLQEFEE